MEEIEVSINPVGKEERLAALIEGAADHYGLQVRMRGTLRTYPGSQHWHLHKPGERGTLEITLWPAGKRVWFSVQAGRRAGWIAEIIPRMKAWQEGTASASGATCTLTQTADGCHLYQAADLPPFCNGLHFYPFLVERLGRSNWRTISRLLTSNAGT